MQHRLYIDEVGNPDFGSCHDHNHRFLSLSGVILDLDHVKNTVRPEMEHLKETFFDHHPDEPLILHRKEIINAKPPFGNLRNDNIRKNFNEKFLSLLTTWNYTVITVCIDKLKHHDKYGEWKYEPYHYCLEIILERYLYFLDTTNAPGDVMAESRGGRADRQLKEVYSRLWETGTHFVRAEKFQSRFSSKQLKIKPKSNNIAGLQLADVLAHPSRNEILDKQGLLEKELAPFSKEIVRILQKKYYKRGQKVYGKKFL